MKTVLVTGANKGIGREVARQLAAKGFHVFVVRGMQRMVAKQPKKSQNKPGRRHFWK
jgi:NAD(P)-dependent dehydrogenase (short-subunit alcohol dehydrogenase family)